MRRRVTRLPAVRAVALTGEAARVGARALGVNDHLRLLLSSAYEARRCDHPEHLADLHQSGLTGETIARQRITSVPPHMLGHLLGFDCNSVVSAYLIPFSDPRGGWMNHIRIKVFPSIVTPKGTIKYLQPKGSGVRIYFPLATLSAVLYSDAPLYLVEGEKKSLAVAQTGLATVGICGVEGWHAGGSRDLHPDLDDVGLRGRVINVVPDSDVRTNPAVRAAVRRLGKTLAARGATARLVRVPEGFKGIDDWLASPR